jgi:excisionase family DNA binding protein
MAIHPTGKMDSEKAEKLASMAEQSASRIAREAMTFFCQAFSIIKDDLINSQPEIEGNKSVTLPSQNLLTVEQVADFLQVKIKTVYSWAETGKIPSHKIGSCLRFDRNKILEATRNEFQLLPNTNNKLNTSNLRMIK